VQQCRQHWRRSGQDFSWDELCHLSAAATPRACSINPDDAAFQGPGDMPEAIRAYCRRTGQSVPADEGSLIRCAIESMALKSRWVLEGLEQLTGGSIQTIHIVGGGTQNHQLCQATADACCRHVVAGPIEATALGNLMVQAISAGAIGSIAESREVVRHSFPATEYEPRDIIQWEDAYQRFKSITGLS
jgi:rhamnulokinase